MEKQLQWRGKMLRQLETVELFPTLVQFRAKVKQNVKIALCHCICYRAASKLSSCDSALKEGDDDSGGGRGRVDGGDISKSITEEGSDDGCCCCDGVTVTFLCLV
ncbi:Uncharacterized protein TCM_019957 [Theobroma cacao]|uniref:Uncharacterized protein n=1 Tax=Theobroma cacao TaxID=3641 RepID=A0A061ER51_THECC|nr:Uncharacterized protein TCM_019957 [Theobroma cacao]